MKCPGCGYTSFDHLSSCKKCGIDFDSGQAGKKSRKPPLSSGRLCPDRIGRKTPVAAGDPREPAGTSAGLPSRAPADREIRLDDFDRLDVAGTLPPLKTSGFLSAWSGSGIPRLEGNFPTPAECRAEPSPLCASEPAPAGALSRLAATVVDLGLLLVFFLFFVVAAEITLGGTQPVATSLATHLAPYFLVFFFLCFGYFTLFHYLVGQTLGKMLFGLRVISLGQEPLLISQAFLRTTGGLISALPAGIGFLVLLADRQGRGWNDRLAGTRVIGIGTGAGSRRLDRADRPAEPEPVGEAAAQPSRSRRNESRSGVCR